MNKIVSAIFLPLSLMMDVINSNRSSLKKILYILIVILIFGSIWISTMRSAISFGRLTLFDLGITDQINKVPVSGTSMMPTIKDGSEIELNSPKKHGLDRGDIVSFKNTETGGIYYLKRIIGLPGEEVSIKNGYYYLNGKALEENYTFNNLPTFGNTFLADCEIAKVPEGHYFVSGDNRTVSTDSRVLGFVNGKDIDGVIKNKKEITFADSIREKEIGNRTINADKFLAELNSKRTKENLGLLATHSLLNQISKERADQIARDYENWKKNTVPLDKLLDSKGYKFNSVHEFVTFGYLDEKDVINQILELEAEKNKFLGGSFTEVGIGVSERKYKECTYPVISVILSWPAVPTYNQADIDSWQKEIQLTNTIMSNMQTWIGAPGVDSSKIRQMISLASEQNQIATRLHNKMTKREWLTNQDYQDIKRYDSSIAAYNKLYDEVFGKVQGATTKKLPAKHD
jgi:signal peptidase I